MQAQGEQAQVVNGSPDGVGDADAAVARTLVLILRTMQSQGDHSQAEQDVRAIINALWVIVNVSLSLNTQQFVHVACLLMLKLCGYAALGAEHRDFIAGHGGIEAAEAASQHFSTDHGICAANEQLKAILTQWL